MTPTFFVYICLLGSVITPLPSLAQAGVSRALTADDYKRLRSLQDIQASPDGKWILLKIGVVDTAKDEYTSDLWLLNPSSRALRQFTRSSGNESSPRFSPDGRQVAFIAPDGERSQVYGKRLTSGAARVLFTFAGDIDGFAWFPDGRHLAFTAADPEPADSVKLEDQVRHYRRTYYKANGTGFLDGRFVHLWVADLVTGRVRKIGGGEFDYQSPAVSPDGRWIAFVSNRTSDRDENRNSDVFVIPADSGAILPVSHEVGSADSPAWSPDGHALAYLEQTMANNYGGNEYLWVAPVSTGSPTAISIGPPRNLTSAMARSVAEGSYDEGGQPYPRWSSDGRTLYVAIEDRARVHGYAIDAATGARRLLLGGDQMVEYLTPVAGGLVFGRTDPAHLADVYLTSEDGTQPKQLTHLNQTWFRDIQVLPAERLSFRSADGAEVEGFVVKPAGFTPGHRYPTVLGIHGGPQWFYPVSYHTQFQIAAGRGYLAVYINPRGSTSYGEDFMSLVHGRYAHADDQDFLTVLDTLIARGWADPDNSFLFGNSYGGIATNWLITRTKRFRAAASSSGVADYTASFGVDDDHIEWLADMGGAPWQVPEKYREQSPMTHIEGVTTPTIFLHGDNDDICPTGESERMYLALKLLGIETELVIFRRENHNFDNKASSFPLRMKLVLDWFDAHRTR